MKHPNCIPTNPVEVAALPSHEAAAFQPARCRAFGRVAGVSLALLVAACGDDGQPATETSGTQGSVSGGTDATNGKTSSGSETSSSGTGTASSGASTASSGSGTGSGSSTASGTSGATTGMSTKSPCPDGMCEGMVEVPAGMFRMGCDELERGCGGASPAHDVYLDGFVIDKYEVTQAQYFACVDAGKCPSPIGCNERVFKAAQPNHPMFCIQWDHAKTYCEVQGKRLPTEAEWEKAARGTDVRTYPWGNDRPTCEHLYFVDRLAPTACGPEELPEVGSYPKGASFYGAMDMSGGVAELVSDWFDEDYYAVSPDRNPQGPTERPGGFRTQRGGDYTAGPDFQRATKRAGEAFGEKTGFRCAKSM